MKALSRAIQFWNLRASWLGEGGDPVPIEQAQRRADVCLKCENNQEKPIYEILGGKAALTALRQIQFKDNVVPKLRSEDCLHVCSVCLCILRLKVHVPLKFILESSSTAGLPPHCWQITEQQTTTTDDNQNTSV